MQPLNVAIVGLGDRGLSFAAYLAERTGIARVCALIDTELARAQAVKEHFDFPAELSSDLPSLKCVADIDAVLLATPDHAHVQPALDAFNENKHLFIEKPLATTLEDCDRIIAAAAQSASICYVGFNLRYSPVHVRVRELILAGRIGKLTTIEANIYYYNGKTYFRRWNRFREFGGGLWLTKACHDFDLITWIAGGRPVSVYATSNLSHYHTKDNAGPRCRDCAIKETCPDYYDIHQCVDYPVAELHRRLRLLGESAGELAPDICLFNSEKDTFDNGIAVINYDNDVRATLTCSVLSARHTRQMRIVGTDGLIEADMDLGRIDYVQRHTEQTESFDLSKEIAGGHGGADDRIFHDFFHLCRHGGTPRSGLQDGRLAVQLSLAARQADDHDTVVPICQCSTQ